MHIYIYDACNSEAMEKNYEKSNATEEKITEIAITTSSKKKWIGKSRF